MAIVEPVDPVNAEHMIDEIQASVRTGDSIKVRLVLDQLPAADRCTRHRLLYELTRADASFSIPMLHALVVKYPELTHSFPIAYETLVSQLTAHPDLLVDALWNPEIPDKSVMIRIAGELQLEAAIPALIGLLGRDEHSDWNQLIVEVLGVIGGSNCIGTLAEFLYSADRDLTITAIRALGRVGTPAAMKWLVERMGTDDELDLLILGMFADVQDEISLEKLNDAMHAHNTQTRVTAKELLVTIGRKTVPYLLRNLRGTDPDFLIHTLNVLGEIGDASAIVPIRKLLSSEPENANVRFAAYETLAMLPLERGAYALAAGLSDPEDHVCIAAARAIDRNLNDILLSGIMNLIRTGNEEAHKIVRTIVNAQVDNLFQRLAEDDVFLTLATDYLPATHEDVRRFHADLLSRIGKSRLADHISRKGRSSKSKVRAKVCAVDDSRVILSIYRNTLHELGFEPVVFEFPASALEWLEKEKPALVFTDLNMPKISGIQLTRQIRLRHDKDDLPVIMVTTQSDVDSEDTIRSAGVNEILPKPFNADSLKDAMARYIRVD